MRAFGYRSFSADAPTLWNALPVNIRNLETLDLFKSTLKTYLFKLAFDLYFCVIIRTVIHVQYLYKYTYLWFVILQKYIVVRLLERAYARHELKLVLIKIGP